MSLASVSQVSVLLAFAALIGWGAISDFSRFIIPNRVCLAIAALYLRGWLRLHAELPHKYTAGKLVSFTSGLFAIVFALGRHGAVERKIDAVNVLRRAHRGQKLGGNAFKRAVRERTA